MQRTSCRIRSLSLIPHSNQETASLAASRAGSLSILQPRSAHHSVTMLCNICSSTGLKDGFVMSECESIRNAPDVEVCEGFVYISSQSSAMKSKSKNRPIAYLIDQWKSPQDTRLKPAYL